MRVHTRRHTLGQGWSDPLPEIDLRHALVLCFGAPEYEHDAVAIKELASLGAPLLGCSTAGEIHGDEVADRSLAVAFIEFDSTPIRTTATDITSETSYEAGLRLATSLASDDLTAVLVLSSGLDVNGSKLVAGISAGLGDGVLITGGLAGDGARFESTWVIVDGEPVSGQVTAVGLYGDKVRVGHGSQGGWDIFGPERTVTRSVGNVVYELDGQPVLALYKRYLGDLAEELPSSGLLFPLSLRLPECERRVVRTILGVDEEAQSLIFAGDVPEGYRVQLMQASFDRLVDGAEDAASWAGRRVGDHASLSIAISCVGRRLVLGARAEDELEATMHALPDGITQIGFYSYGEISPYGDGEIAGSCELHNQTMTLTTIGEVE